MCGGWAGGGERTDALCSSSVGELDTGSVGEGVAAVIEAKVLVHAETDRADVGGSGTLVTPVVGTGFTSLDTRLLPAVAVASFWIRGGAATPTGNRVSDQFPNTEVVETAGTLALLSGWGTDISTVLSGVLRASSISSCALETDRWVP